MQDVRSLSGSHLKQYFLDNFSNAQLKKLLKYSSVNSKFLRGVHFQSPFIRGCNDILKLSSDLMRERFPIWIFLSCLHYRLDETGHDYFRKSYLDKGLVDKLIGIARSIIEGTGTQSIEALSNSSPEKLKIFNKVTSEVIVSPHAWVRFLERAVKMDPRKAKQYPYNENIFNKLRVSFSMAKKVKLPDKVRFKREAGYDYITTDYLLDSKWNLRYVVPSTEPRVLKTVEIPYE